MPKITILWGSSPEPGDRAKTYQFATQAELDAFMMGVDEASGWMDWSLDVEEGYVVPSTNIVENEVWPWPDKEG